MKKNLYTINLIAVILLSASILFGQRTAVRDTLSMGSGYAEDIFYSFENGEISKAARNTWDIAFYTSNYSAGIITNEGNGVILYSYPGGDTSSWANIDTTGLFGWTKMYNYATEWEEGAFNINAKGHPDYGWGIYNSVNHNLYGDSLFVIYTPDAGYKKLWIKQKKSGENIYLFKFADIDGANEHDIEFDINPYLTKRFAYYSIANNELVDREPDATSWDILFTKYDDLVPNNEGDSSHYVVTGALSNVDIGANHFYPVTEDFNIWPEQPFDYAKNAIGWDWKSFDMGTFSWKVTDSNYYFVQNYNGDIYKLKFVYWAGSTTGDFALDKWLVSLSSVEESNLMNNGFDIYPNPSQSSFTIKSNTLINEDCQLMIMDQAGRLIYQKTYSASDIDNGVKLNDLSMRKGLYLITIQNKHQTNTQKLIIN